MFDDEDRKRAMLELHRGLDPEDTDDPFSWWWNEQESREKGYFEWPSELAWIHLGIGRGLPIEWRPWFHAEVLRLAGACDVDEAVQEWLAELVEDAATRAVDPEVVDACREVAGLVRGAGGSSARRDKAATAKRLEACGERSDTDERVRDLASAVLYAWFPEDESGFVYAIEEAAALHASLHPESEHPQFEAYQHLARWLIAALEQGDIAPVRTEVDPLDALVESIGGSAEVARRPVDNPLWSQQAREEARRAGGLRLPESEWMHPEVRETCGWPLTLCALVTTVNARLSEEQRAWWQQALVEAVPVGLEPEPAVWGCLAWLAREVAATTSDAALQKTGEQLARLCRYRASGPERLGPAWGELSTSLAARVGGADLGWGLMMFLVAALETRWATDEVAAEAVEAMSVGRVLGMWLDAGSAGLITRSVDPAVSDPGRPDRVARQLLAEVGRLTDAG